MDSDSVFDFDLEDEKPELDETGLIRLEESSVEEENGPVEEKKERAPEFYLEVLGVDASDKGSKKVLFRLIDSPYKSRPLNSASDIIVVPKNDLMDFAGYEPREDWRERNSVKEYLNGKGLTELVRGNYKTVGASISQSVDDLEGRIYRYKPGELFEYFKRIHKVGSQNPSDDESGFDSFIDELKRDGEIEIE